MTAEAATLRRVLAALQLDEATHRALADEYRAIADAHEAVADAMERLESLTGRAPDTLPPPESP